jgi:hypothetical protein
MHPKIKSELQNLERFDQALIALHLLCLHSRKPPLPHPVHFALVASLCMFALLPLMPHRPLAIPISIGGGLSFAFMITSWRKLCQK